MTERRIERNTHTKEKKTKDWLKKGTATALVGVGVGAAALGIGFGVKEARSNDEVKPATGITQTIATPTTSEAGAGLGNNPEVTATTIAEMTSTTEKVNTEPTNSTTSTTESDIEIKSTEIGSITIVNAPEKVDSAVVDTAKGDFKNTIGFGSEMAFAEPGVLLVGPDFGYTGSENPMGKNPQGWETMYDAEGSIRPFSSVSQEVIRFEGPAYQNLPEGGWVLASAAEMTAKIGDVTLKLNHKENNNYFLVVRGYYGDIKQDTDRNETIKFTDYKPGHLLVNMYESRDETNAAFISEGQFKQMAETSHSHGTNGGDGGNSVLTVVCYDANTKAYAILEQKLDRNTDTGNNWRSVASNWFNK